MKAAWMGMIAAAALVAAGNASADQALAQKSGCLACHAVDKKVVGPSFKDIAAKYKGDGGAAAKLADKVKKGGSGAWGQVPMPPNAQVKDEDIKKLVGWVLATK
ncbi:MAG: c-type cytochrome [Betaproteobacteria bacterium]|nr:c-type cytochrome [Betaproteobacteria bacterium]